VKMIMISYNEALDIEVMEALEKCDLKNYTKLSASYGKGVSSGTHMGDDIWPGRNNILYVACEDSKAKALLFAIKSLREQFKSEGVKAFVLPLEEIT